MSEARFSARRAVILGFGGLGVLLAGLGGWGAFASIAGAVIATGQVAVESRNRAVEHIDGGTVSEVPVRDGDTVEQGDVLLRFSASLLRSEEAILKARYVEFAARRNRLEAEYRGRDAISWDPDLAALAEEDPKFRDAMAGQERLFRARRAAGAGEAARLRERIKQTRGEIEGLEVQAVALGHQSGLIARELEAQRQLYKKGLTRISPVLALERAARGLEGTAGAIAADIARARGRIAEYEIAILQIETERIEKAEEEARQAKAGENEVLEQLASVRERLGRREVRAPVSGTVFGATVFAPGEVVRSGEPIMQIVPKDSGLVVMARIAPIHVDQVYPGQEAVLRFSAFQMHQTPEFPGRVVRVSADAVHDVEAGQSWYEVELALAPAEDGADGDDPLEDRAPLPGGLLLAPGMPVEVHIRTGERSVLSYLAKPMADFFERALREE